MQIGKLKVHPVDREEAKPGKVYYVVEERRANAGKGHARPVARLQRKPPEVIGQLEGQQGPGGWPGIVRRLLGMFEVIQVGKLKVLRQVRHA
jgi:hypothetical protein